MDSFLSNNQDFPDIGTLQVNVFSQNNYNPITNATVTIQNTIPQTNGTSEQLSTDSSGQTETISLRTPPLEYSLTPESSMPYSEYNITVSAPGYETTVLTGAQILPDVKAIQDIRLVPLPGTEETQEQDIDIAPHTLYAEYPPKIPEAEIKTVADTGEIILSQVVIPEYIIVHDGLPDDNSAPNYYITYKDYIKNVASSEVYATWPESTLYANILAIMSFTLNRVYTEW